MSCFRNAVCGAGGVTGDGAGSNGTRALIWLNKAAAPACGAIGRLMDDVTSAGDGSAARLGISWAFSVSFAVANGGALAISGCVGSPRGATRIRRSIPLPSQRCGNAMIVSLISVIAIEIPPRLQSDNWHAD